MRGGIASLTMLAVAGLVPGLAAAQPGPDRSAGPQGTGWVLTSPAVAQSPTDRCRWSAETAARVAVEYLQMFDATVTIELKDAETSCKLTMADAARTVDFEGQPD